MFDFERFYLSFIKLVMAILFSLVLALEREWHSHPGGVTTHILVSMGSCVFTMLSVEFQKNDEENGDVARVAAQIVSGMGFLGSATVYKSNNFIKGINSAASLWLSAGVGMSAGVEEYEIGLVASIATAILLIFNNRYRKRLYRKKKKETQTIDIESQMNDDIFVDNDIESSLENI